MRDFLIIGQGIGGTLLCDALLNKGKDVIVIDRGLNFGSSSLAAGIVNPVTGRRFVKSWLIDTLLPSAIRVYQDLEQRFQVNCLEHRFIHRALPSSQMEESWLLRTSDHLYSNYLDEKIYKSENQHFRHVKYGIVNRGLQVDLSILINTYRKYLLSQKRLINDLFNYEELQISLSGVSYQHVKAKHVIFCEGAHILSNPWFNTLPVIKNKGEVLIVDIPGLKLNVLVKHQVFIVPLESGHFWIGSTYDRHPENGNPSEQGLRDLTRRLESCLKSPFRILKHAAAIRPTVDDRRPLLGTHPRYPVLHVFNGLGTKGASLGPYFANMMADYLVGKGEILRGADLQRFHAIALK